MTPFRSESSQDAQGEGVTGEPQSDGDQVRAEPANAGREETAQVVGSIAGEPSQSAAPIAEAGHAANYSGRCYDRIDWLGFWITFGCVLVVYLWTLAPEVTLEFSGVMATSAMYGSGAHPPGYPVWSLYAWLFIHLLPVSNVAWRIAVSSAVAGAVACGMVALMVSRGGALLLEGVGGLKRLNSQEEQILRIACAVFASMTFAFHRMFWGESVIVESTALGMALFCLTLCLLQQWIMNPKRAGSLCAAFFVFGLTLSVRLSWAAGAAGLPFIVKFRRRDLGRDLLFVIASFIGVFWLATSMGWVADGLAYDAEFFALKSIFMLVALIAAAVSSRDIVKTRALLTRWRMIIVSLGLLAAGLSIYFYLPVASMTNPPMNWGYPRTVEGFVNTVGRGQYEELQPGLDCRMFPLLAWAQLHAWMALSAQDFGLVPLVIALVPLFCLRRMKLLPRCWTLGLLVTGIFLAAITINVINPLSEFDGGMAQVISRRLPPTHVIPAILYGYGLILVGTVLAGRPALPRRLLSWLARV